MVKSNCCFGKFYDERPQSGEIEGLSDIKNRTALKHPVRLFTSKCLIFRAKNAI
jgi:hypothetical protein